MRVLYITILISYMALVSCHKPKFGCSKLDEKKSQKHFYKGFAKCERKMQELSAQFWPVIESVRDSIVYKMGKPDTVVGPTVYVNCDSVKGSVPVKCPDCICPGRDTIERYRRIVQESRALLLAEQDKSRSEATAARASIDRLTAENSRFAIEDGKKGQQIADLKKGKRTQRLWIWVLAGYLVGSRVVKWRFPIIGKFLP